MAAKKKAAASKPRVKAGTSAQAAAERRERFVEAYITNGGNGKQAAITAGFAVSIRARSRERAILRCGNPLIGEILKWWMRERVHRLTYSKVLPRLKITKSSL